MKASNNHQADSLFDLMVSITREHAAGILAEDALNKAAGKPVSRPSATCKCNAYRFPHRIYSGACTGRDEQSAGEVNQEILDSFDAAEANAINRSR